MSARYAAWVVKNVFCTVVEDLGRKNAEGKVSLWWKAAMSCPVCCE